MTGHFEPVHLAGASLSGIEILSDLSAEERNSLAGRCQGRRYQPEAQIVSQNDAEADVYFIVSGTVRVTFFSASGKEISFRDQGPGKMFGELAAIDHKPRSAYVVALTESVVATLSDAAFRQVLVDYPAVTQAALRHLANLVRLLSDRVIEFSTLGVRNRIHAELLRLATGHGVGNNAAAVSPCPTHAEIASRVSTHREAVSREFSHLASTALLKRDGNVLHILDMERLARMVADVHHEA